MTADDASFRYGGITGPGADHFGQGPAEAAYTTAVLFTMNEGVDGPSLTKTGPVTDQDLAPAKAAMTPAAFASLKAYADKANAGDKDARNQLAYILPMDVLRGSDWTFRPGTAPVVSRKTFGPATSSVFGRTLSMQFNVEADYQLLNDKKQPVTIHVNQDVTYAMAPVGQNWLIDGWTIKTSPNTTTNG